MKRSNSDRLLAYVLVSCQRTEALPLHLQPWQLVSSIVNDSSFKRRDDYRELGGRHKNTMATRLSLSDLDQERLLDCYFATAQQAQKILVLHLLASLLQHSQRIRNFFFEQALDQAVNSTVLEKICICLSDAITSHSLKTTEIVSVCQRGLLAEGSLERRALFGRVLASSAAGLPHLAEIYERVRSPGLRKMLLQQCLAIAGGHKLPRFIQDELNAPSFDGSDTVVMQALKEAQASQLDQAQLLLEAESVAQTGDDSRLAGLLHVLSFSKNQNALPLIRRISKRYLKRYLQISKRKIDSNVDQTQVLQELVSLTSVIGQARRTRQRIEGRMRKRR